MKVKILLFILTSLIVCFQNNPLLATIYYIAKTGNDNNPGTETEPWQTISKANTTLRPGDTVYIRAGTYEETIKPSRSGTEGNYLTYKAYEGETVKITNISNGVELDNKCYVIIDRINIINIERKFIYIWGSGAHHNIVQNCYMDGNTSGHGWGSVHIHGGSTYNKILNNTIKNGHGDVVYITKESCYNLVQGNEIDGRGCGHATLSIRGFEGDKVMAGYNIIKNNIIHGGSDDNLHPSQWTEHNFFDGNIMHTTTIEPGSGYKACGGYYNVVRNNIAYDNVGYGFGIYTNLYTPASPEAKGNIFYNNVSYDNGGGGDNMHSGFRLVVYKGGLPLHHTIVINNIIYKNFKEMYLTVANHDKSKYYNNIFQRNNIFHNNPGDKTIKYFETMYSLVEMESNYPNEFKDNLEVDPLFVDAKNYDFHLLPNSQMIDAGRYLTFTTSSGSGTKIYVENANFFCDGFGLIEGDLIQLEGQTDRAKITKVDYDNNTLTLNTTLTWYSGQGVSLAYNGSAPDIGAFEYASAPDTTPPSPPTRLRIIE